MQLYVATNMSCTDQRLMRIALMLFYTLYFMQLYVATNMNCTDQRLMRIALMLSRRSIRLLCAKDMIRDRLPEQDNYFVSLVEQELCQRGSAFMGSKYSTWTDTVWGARVHNDKSSSNWVFEELWALGIR